jgi:hypothetical protein
MMAQQLRRHQTLTAVALGMQVILDLLVLRLHTHEIEARIASIGGVIIHGYSPGRRRVFSVGSDSGCQETSAPCTEYGH